MFWYRKTCRLTFCTAWLINRNQCKFDKTAEIKSTFKNKEAQTISTVHKDLMKKNSNVPINNRNERENVRFREPSSYVQHIALEKRTNILSSLFPPSLHVLCCPKTLQQTQSSPNDNTANALTTKLLHLAWVSLQTTHECEILETTLNIKKAMRRQCKRHARTVQESDIRCSVHVLKEILWFLLHYITFKPLRYRFFFHPQECQTCIFTPFTYIKEALELRVTQQAWQYSEIKYATALKISFIEKQKN